MGLKRPSKVLSSWQYLLPKLPSLLLHVTPIIRVRAKKLHGRISSSTSLFQHHPRHSNFSTPNQNKMALGSIYLDIM